MSSSSSTVAIGLPFSLSLGRRPGTGLPGLGVVPGVPGRVVGVGDVPGLPGLVVGAGAQTNSSSLLILFLFIVCLYF